MYESQKYKQPKNPVKDLDNEKLDKLHFYVTDDPDKRVYEGKAYNTLHYCDGFLAIDLAEWEQYSGKPYKRKVLEDFFRDFQCYCNNQVLGTKLYKRIVVDGEGYLATQPCQDYSAFYGPEKLAVHLDSLGIFSYKTIKQVKELKVY